MQGPDTDPGRTTAPGLTAVAAASAQAIFAVDAADHVELWNDAAERLYGWPEAAVLGEPNPVVPAAEQAGHDDLVARVRDGQVVTGVVTRHRTRDGGLVDVDLSMAPLGEGGSVDGRVLVVEERAGRGRADYEAVLDRVGDMVYVADADGRLQFLNDAAAAFVGHARGDLVGEHVSTVLAEDSVDRGRAVVRELLERGEPDTATYELDILTAGGDRIRCENHVSLLPAGDGEFRGTVGVVRDIDARKARELELARYERILDTVPVGVLVLDENAHVDWVNEEFWTTIGRTEEAVLGTQFLELVEAGFVEADLVEEYLAAVKTLLSSENDTDREVLEFEVDPPGESGTLDYEGYIGLRPMADGAFRGTVNAFLDVTARTERERDLARYKTAMETVPDGVFTLDAAGRMTRVNAAWANTVGYPPSALEGEPFTMLVEAGVVDEAVVEDYLDVVRDLLSSEPTPGRSAFTARMVPPGDTDEHVYEATVGLLPHEETFQGSTVIVRDVTESVHRREELRRQNERLEAFASIVSHDLRNPLTVAAGRVDMARETGDVGHLETVTDAHRRMEAIIDDVLALARGSDAAEDREPVDLAELVATSWSTVDTRDAALEVAGELPRVLADGDRAGRLLENLFRNAVDHGGADVRVEVGPLDGTGFYVEDDGPGVDPPARDRLFERGVSTDDDGAGLGLAIVRQIAETHGWSVRFAEPGDGARVEVTEVEPP